MIQEVKRVKSNERKRVYMQKYRERHPEKVKKSCQKWINANPQKYKAKQDRHHVKYSRKGGEYYIKMLKYMSTGIQKGRNRIRRRDRSIWQPYKEFLNVETEVHHAWVDNTVEYNGIAIVDKSEHQHNIIKSILIMDGTVLIMPRIGVEQSW